MRILARFFVGVALLVGLTACPPKMIHVDGRQMTVDEAARVEFENARAKVAAGDPARGAELFEQVARRYPHAPEADEALFGAGQAWETAGQRLKARAAYDELLSRYPRSDKADLARERIAALGGGNDEALARAREAYERLPQDRKFDAATQNASSAEAAGNGAEAFHWRVEALHRAPTAGGKSRAEAELKRLLGSLSALDVERLVDTVDARTEEAPLVHAQMAQIHHQRRDWDQLQSSLRDFLRRWPSDVWAPQARELLAKVEKRGQASPMKVGVVLPLSGQYRAYGQQLKAGIEYAMRGSGIQLVIRDSRGEAEEAAGQIENLVFEEHVIAAIGGILTTEADAAAHKADELGLPFFAFSRTEDFTGRSEWIFRDMLTNGQIADALVDFAMNGRQMKRFAVLHPELPYGEEMLQLFWERVEKNGGEVRKAESYAPDTTTFSEPIRKLVSRDQLENREEYLRKVRELRAQKLDARQRRNAMERIRAGVSPQIDFDALFVPDQWKTVALIAPALAFEDVITNWCDTRDIERIEKTTGQKVRPVMMLGGNLWNHPELPTRAGKYVNCSVFVDGFHAASSRTETASFVESFNRAYGKNPGLLEAYAAEAGTVVRWVIENQRPQTHRQFRDMAAEVSGIPGPMGPITMGEQGDVLHPLYLLTVDRGSIREADPTLPGGAL